MNTLDKKYTDLLQDILDNGVKKETRNGGTISVFGRQIRHKMSEGFPLLTTKKMYFKGIVTELLWFLRGDSDIRFLWENNCSIWDGDWHKKYKTTCSEPYTLEEVKQKVKEGNHSFHDSMFDMGPIYGKQWRNWEGNGSPLTKDYEGNVSSYLVKSIDQITNLIHDLKTNPDSRRLMVNAWNVGELDQMVLPPCHYGFQVYTRELSDEEKWEQYSKSGLNIEINGIPLELKHMRTPFYPKSLPKRAISLMWNQRSVDTFLGLPFNIASYGLLLEIIAKEVNMVPDELIGNLGDTHLYLNHIEQAKEQIGREFTKKEIQEHLQQSGMDALKDEPRMEYISKLPKRTREPHPLPKLGKIPDYLCRKDNWECYKPSDFTLENYQSHPSIKAPLSN
jgi:thymidylate synthase